MNKILGFLFAALLMSGCAMTAKLPPAPDADSLTKLDGATNVGVVKVEDARGTVKAGMISAQPMEVDAKIADFCTNYLIRNLNSETKVNITPLGAISEAEIASSASKNNLERVLVAKLKSIQFSSIDAIMQPVQTDMQMDVFVYNQSAEIILKKNYFGKAKKWLGLTTGVNSTGKLVDASTQDLMKSLANDAELKAALIPSKTSTTTVNQSVSG